MKTTLATIVAACALAGCDQARWVELPPLVMQCGDLDDEFQKELANPNKYSMARGMLQSACQQTGAKDFDGAARCRNDVVEVRCKG